MRRANFFFAFGDEHKIYGQLFPCAAHSVQRGKKCRFRSFLIHRAATDEHFAETGLVDQCRIKWRRSPLRGIGLLYVVHEIEADCARSTCIENSKNSGLSVCGNFPDLPEARVAEHVHGQVAALVHAAIFSCDGGLLDPVLQTLHGFVVALLNFRPNPVHFVRGHGCPRPVRPGKCRGAGRGSLQEDSPVCYRFVIESDRALFRSALFLPATPALLSFEFKFISHDFPRLIFVRRSDEEMAALTPLFLLRDPSPFKTGAYSISNCLPWGSQKLGRTATTARRERQSTAGL